MLNIKIRIFGNDCGHVVKVKSASTSNDARMTYFHEMPIRNKTRNQNF